MISPNGQSLFILSKKEKEGFKLEKKPFHEVIVDEMKEVAKLVAASAGAEDCMRGFGDIFRKAILPKDKKSEIAKAIMELAKDFPNASSDTVSAQRYLEALAEDIGM